MSDEKKELEIVSGDGSNLDIPPVYEHLNSAEPRPKKPTNIVIPKEETKKKSKKTNSKKND